MSRLSIEEEKRRMELYEQGLNDVEIGDKINICHGSVQEWRITRNLSANKSHTLTEYEEQKRRNLYNKGLNDSQIAKKTNTVYQSIQRWRIRRNLHSNIKGGGQLKKIELPPNFELGYFCGVVLGDGWLSKVGRRHSTNIGSTRSDTIVKYFKESAERLKFKPSKIYEGKYGSICEIYSKILYEALRPYKQKDFHWDIPEFLTTKKSQLGFISGLFDAEGCVKKHSLIITSKHKSNLEPVRDLLLKFGFKYGKISINKEGKAYVLGIYGLNNHKLFLDKIRLRLKKSQLEEKLKGKIFTDNLELYKKVMELRKEKNWGQYKIAKYFNCSPSKVGNWVYNKAIPTDCKYRL